MARWTRRRYLINKKIQLRYAVIAIWVIAVTTILVGIIVYYTIWSALLSKYISGSPELISLQAEIDSILGKRLIWVGGFLLLIGAWLEIWFLHRIVGPLYRIERTIKEAAEGKFPERPIKLRTKDFYRSLAEALNKLFASLKKNPPD